MWESLSRLGRRWRYAAPHSASDDTAARAAAGQVASLHVAPRAPPLLIVLPIATGAGLVTYILAGVSLPLAIGAVAAVGAGLWLAAMPRLSIAAKRNIRTRVGIGLCSGFLATVAYDLTRYGIVAVAGLTFRPFHVWSLFGAALIGERASEISKFVVGAGFHLANGLGFAIAYLLLVRRPSILTGLLWAGGLEFAMVLLYPRWLDLSRFGEFLTVSILGHAAYGCVLGLTARELLRRSPRTVPGRSVP